MALISVGIPVFNEELTLGPLYERLVAAVASLGHDVEIVFVDDGSTDRSEQILRELAERDPRVRVVRLSRNFGHQPACTAAVRYARGDAVVLMDGDLQDPPELIPDLVREWEKGFRVVLARRRSRPETGVRGLLINLFHRSFRWLTGADMPADVGVFSLMSAEVADEIAHLPERNRYLPGLRWWVGHRSAEVWYDRSPRSAGEPKQSLESLFRYALDAIFSFSYRPLRAATLLGLAVSGLSFTYAMILLVLRLLQINVVLGFTTQAVAIFFFGGVQLIFIGILGEYMARTYDEVKRRPLYVVESVHGTAAERLTRGSAAAEPALGRPIQRPS
jgi:dolichol-phosphate mannosyltransferase